jgi:hypothetical protein
MNSTTWPENTVARYLTVGGATVDITQRDEYQFSATCAGCGTNTWGTFNAATDSEKTMRGHAQTHAETCRAIPRPTN